MTWPPSIGRSSAAEEGVLFIGKAQEKTPVFRTERRRNEQTGATYPWLVRSTAMVNHFYVYCVDRAGSRSRTRGPIPGRSRRTWVTGTSSTRFGTRSWRRGASRASSPTRRSAGEVRSASFTYRDPRTCRRLRGRADQYKSPIVA